MKNYCTILLSSFLTLCFAGCGTLGGFSTIIFDANKKQLTLSIDSLYSNYPKYKIPEKWKKFDNWNKRGYGFLDSRIFYFENSPEEMYYVTFLGDSTMQFSSQTSIAIRAVCKGTGKWLLQEEFNDSEVERIETRFDSEILSKIKYAYHRSD